MGTAAAGLVCRHSQSMLAAEMAGRRGALIRLHMPIKYGYKQIKRIGDRVRLVCRSFVGIANGQEAYPQQLKRDLVAR
jgi:DMSO/TMAO reductase YedYZ molybdopterin-dependent catalytic subunit